MNKDALFQYFVVAGLINTTLFAFLLMTRKKHTVVSILLTVFMLLVSFQAVLNGFDNRAFFLEFPHLSRVSWLLPTLFGPLIYLFTGKLTMRETVLRAKDLLHFLPFCVYLLLLSSWFVKPASEKRALLSDFEALSVHDFGWMNQVNIPLTLFYLLLSLQRLHQYRKELTNTCSEVGLYQLQWLRQFIYIVLAILGITALGFYGRKWNIPLIGHMYHYNYAAIVLVLYWMAYKSITQPALFSLEGRQKTRGRRVILEKGVATEMVLAGVVMTPIVAAAGGQADELAEKGVGLQDVGEENTSHKKYAKSGLGSMATDELLQELLTYMEKDKPYLEPELTIYALADALGSNRHHLSQVINERLGFSFFDFVNRYRVKAVQEKLADPGARHMSIMGIAYDCGFNSKATFNASFKKMTGTTPSAYLKSLS
ncbi:helix-turn-helix domain-containing protein [Paraflavitalea sp. CAU 1676]|nr:helix-turn-helix domain-containing protein [Paraflavitalea sp. CAU 1676]